MTNKPINLLDFIEVSTEISEPTEMFAQAIRCDYSILHRNMLKFSKKCQSFKLIFKSLI